MWAQQYVEAQPTNRQCQLSLRRPSGPGFLQLQTAVFPHPEMPEVAGNADKVTVTAEREFAPTGPLLVKLLNDSDE